MKLEPTMFREYDIRGRENDAELNEQALFLIGCGYGTWLRRRSILKVVAGRDSRATSAQFHKALIAGLVSTGSEVLDIGLVTTPMLYWAQFHFQTAGGAMVTASHNPAGWNGVKLAVGQPNAYESAERFRGTTHNGTVSVSGMSPAAQTRSPQTLLLLLQNFFSQSSML